MNKLEFVARQLDKTKKKRYEQLVVHRIWNMLDDLRIKFVTQQFVRRPDGRAMTDMYFPQFGIHIKVDEGHHKAQIGEDKLREADIVDATGHKVLRVDVTKSLEEIHAECDCIVETIKARVADHNFVAWDLEGEMDPPTYVAKGEIDIADDAAFRTMADAASCFGKTYKGLQRAYIRHPVEAGKYLWFPKFYENDTWNNQFQDGEETVVEICKTGEYANTYIEEALSSDPKDVRLLFARVRGPLGDLLYRYKGEYVLDRETTRKGNGRVYRRNSTRSKTYAPANTPNVEREEMISTDFQELYDSTIVDWSENDQLKLASLILSGISDRKES